MRRQLEKENLAHLLVRSNSLKGAEGAYFGYWCFDIALAVMLLDIPDAALKKSAYYPADLVDAAQQAAP